jgi:hypothetical protein
MYSKGDIWISPFIDGAFKWLAALTTLAIFFMGTCDLVRLVWKLACKLGRMVL